MYKRDAETRRNAVHAVAELIVTVGLGKRHVVSLVQQQQQQQQQQPQQQLAAAAGGVGSDSSSTGRGLVVFDAEAAAPGLTPSQFGALFSALCNATHDYATDNRGDVGR